RAPDQLVDEADEGGARALVARVPVEVGDDDVDAVAGAVGEDGGGVGVGGDLGRRDRGAGVGVGAAQGADLGAEVGAAAAVGPAAARGTELGPDPGPERGGVGAGLAEAPRPAADEAGGA